MSVEKVVSLREVCKKAKIEPKVARSHLRGAKRGEVPKPVGKRWGWKPADAAKVVKFLAA